MTDYHHTKFGLIWMKGSKVTEGVRNPQVENVLKRPGEIGLSQILQQTGVIESFHPAQVRLPSKIPRPIASRGLYKLHGTLGDTKAVN